MLSPPSHAVLPPLACCGTTFFCPDVCRFLPLAFRGVVASALPRCLGGCRRRSTGALARPNRVEEHAVKLHVCRGCIGVQMSQFPFNQGAERGNRLFLKFAHPQDVKGMRDCPCRGQVEFAWGVIHLKKWRIVAQLLVSLVLYFPRLRAKPDNLESISCQRCPL